MMDINSKSDKKSILQLFKLALKGDNNFDYTSGSIKTGIILLAIPMVLEMVMESVFAIVDLYFVGHLKESSLAVQSVGLTESILSIIYSFQWNSNGYNCNCCQKNW